MFTVYNVCERGRKKWISNNDNNSANQTHSLGLTHLINTFTRPKIIPINNIIVLFRYNYVRTNFFSKLHLCIHTMTVIQYNQTKFYCLAVPRIRKYRRSVLETKSCTSSVVWHWHCSAIHSKVFNKQDLLPICIHNVILLLGILHSSFTFLYSVEFFIIIMAKMMVKYTSCLRHTITSI